MRSGVQSRKVGNCVLIASTHVELVVWYVDDFAAGAVGAAVVW